MNEGEFYTKMFYPQLKRWGAAWNRVENLIGSGIPDVNLSLGHRQAWVELKMIHSQKIYFEKLQLPWFLERSRQSLTGLWVLAFDEKHYQIYLYGPVTLLKAPRTKVDKWTVVHCVDLVPTVTGTPCKETWNEVEHEILKDNYG